VFDKVLVTQSQAFSDALAKILNEHIGLSYQAMKDLNPACVFKVEGDASFLAVQGFKIGVKSSGKLR
jgi:hypothetical protein